MWPNPHETADLVTFSEEFFCAVLVAASDPTTPRERTYAASLKNRNYVSIVLSTKL